MFKYESEMIPVLIESLSKVFNTEYITTEFKTGNGIADLVFTTDLSKENIYLNDYGMMSLFVNLFQQKKKLKKELLYANCFDKIQLKKLLTRLEYDDFIYVDGNNIIKRRNYKAHTQNLFSVEAKLNDWKSGFYQALRYKFFSHKSYLAYPKQYIHRVDLELLKENNIGLISVEHNSIRIIHNPKSEKPQDLVSFFFLSESFAQKFRPTQLIEA